MRKGKGKVDSEDSHRCHPPAPDLPNSPMRGEGQGDTVHFEMMEAQRGYVFEQGHPVTK